MSHSCVTERGSRALSGFRLDQNEDHCVNRGVWQYERLQGQIKRRLSCKGVGTLGIRLLPGTSGSKPGRSGADCVERTWLVDIALARGGDGVATRCDREGVASLDLYVTRHASVLEFGVEGELEAAPCSTKIYGQRKGTVV